jgi:hypothetical protein
MSGTRSGMTMETDWFGGGYPPGYHTQAAAERPVKTSATSAFMVTTEDVLDVLGPDADDVLATANLDIDALISMINAETVLLPRIDDELEAMFADEACSITPAESARLAAEAVGLFHETLSNGGEDAHPDALRRHFEAKARLITDNPYGVIFVALIFQILLMMYLTMPILFHAVVDFCGPMIPAIAIAGKMRRK